MTLEVLYSGGKDTWPNAGTWDLKGGSLVVYDAQRKHVMVAYGPYQWIKARWVDEAQ